MTNKYLISRTRDSTLNGKGEILLEKKYFDDLYVWQLSYLCAATKANNFIKSISHLKIVSVMKISQTDQ